MVATSKVAGFCISAQQKIKTSKQETKNYTKMNEKKKTTRTLTTIKIKDPQRKKMNDRSRKINGKEAREKKSSLLRFLRRGARWRDVTRRGAGWVLM